MPRPSILRGLGSSRQHNKERSKTLSALNKYFRKSESDLGRLKSQLDKKEEETLSAEKVKVFLDALTTKDAANIKGVFRISGRADDVRAVKDQVIKGNPIIVPGNLDDEDSAHVIATALKGYLTSAEKPVVPSESYDEFLASTEIAGTEVRVLEVRRLLKSLPENHMKVLELLTSFMISISTNHEVNLMTLDNCGIIFGPVFFRPMTFDHSYITNVPRQSRAAEFLISHHSQLFDSSNKCVLTFSDATPEQRAELFPAPVFLRNKAVSVQEEDSEEDLDEVIKDDDFDRVEQEEMPSCIGGSEEEKDGANVSVSVLPHCWKNEKSTAISWCANCEHIIAPKSKKKPIKFKVCQQCDKPVHIKCSSALTHGCMGTIKTKSSKLIAVGQEGPDFQISVREDGTPLTLYNLLDMGKKVILFFYPKSFTPLCTMQNKCFRNNYDYFHYANCEVVGVSSDSMDCQKRFAEQYKLPFHFISDADGKLRSAYRVPQKLGGMMPGRVTFVLAPFSHRIMKIHNSSMTATDHVYISLKIVGELLQMESQVGSISMIDFSKLERKISH